jgi:hypothetical protein
MLCGDRRFYSPFVSWRLYQNVSPDDLRVIPLTVAYMND